MTPQTIYLACYFNTFMCRLSKLDTWKFSLWKRFVCHHEKKPKFLYGSCIKVQIGQQNSRIFMQIYGNMWKTNRSKNCRLLYSKATSNGCHIQHFTCTSYTHSWNLEYRLPLHLTDLHFFCNSLCFWCSYKEQKNICFVCMKSVLCYFCLHAHEFRWLYK